MDTFNIRAGSELMQLDAIKGLLEQTYWANTRDMDTIIKSIKNSLCYGAFLEESGKQIGFSRVITDYATTYYICDVIVDEPYRGMGVGKALLDAIHSNQEITSLRGMLATRDAHDFYRKYGFRVEDNIYMGRPKKPTV